MSTANAITASGSPGASTEAMQQPGKIKNNYFDGLSVGRFHKVVFFTIMISIFVQQMNNANFSYIAPAIVKSAGMSMAYIGKITLCYFIAMTLGAIFGGVFSDMIGRRKTFLGSLLLLTVASLVNGWTDSPIVFIIARALTGFGIFSLMVCAQTYIAEISPAEGRGKWQGRVQAVGFLGMPAIGLLSRIIIPMSPDAWRSIFYIGGLGLVAFIMACRYLPESPRWFITHKRQADAEAVIRQLTGRNIDLTDAANRSVSQGSAKQVFRGMVQQKYRGRTLLLLVLYASTMPVLFTLFTWMGVLLQGKGFDLQDCLLAALIMQLFIPVGAYMSSLVSDMGGRKIPLITTLLLTAVCFAILGTSDSYIVIVVAGCVAQACTTISYSISFIYCSELYPTRMRNTAVGIQNAAGRLATAGFQPILPAIFAAMGFLGVCGANVVFLLIASGVIAIWGLRTGGKSLEEIN